MKAKTGKNETKQEKMKENGKKIRINEKKWEKNKTGKNKKKKEKIGQEVKICLFEK